MATKIKWDQVSVGDLLLCCRIYELPLPDSMGIAKEELIALVYEGIGTEKAQLYFGNLLQKKDARNALEQEGDPRGKASAV